MPAMVVVLQVEVTNLAVRLCDIQSLLPIQTGNGGYLANVEEQKIESRELRRIRSLQKIICSLTELS